VTNYGTWVYALLFLIIFVETGVVVMPFLPGDSLLFVVGAMCGVGLMDYPLSVALLWPPRCWATRATTPSAAASGPRCSSGRQSRFFNKRAFDQAHASTRSTAASPSSRRASCRSCAPSPRSWPAWRR
jgi:membrane-associated protein